MVGSNDFQDQPLNDCKGPKDRQSPHVTIAKSAKLSVAGAQLIFGGGEKIICHVVYAYEMLAMVNDDAHACVADLDWVMIQCVYRHMKRWETIRTCECIITTKFVILNDSHVRS